MLQHMHRQEIAAMKAQGASEATIKAAQDRLKSLSQPVVEQFRFKKKVVLPFAPSENVSIRFPEINFCASQIAWDRDHFEAYMLTHVDNETIVHLMDEAHGWIMSPPGDDGPTPCAVCGKVHGQDEDEFILFEDTEEDSDPSS
jgi:hypothetical protein